MRPINCLCIHHTASPSGNVVQFRKEHKARGWRDIGYHYIIGNGHGADDGELQVGRPEAMEGSAVYSANAGKLHISLVGQFDANSPGCTGKPSRAQFDTLGEWLLKKGHQYGLRSGAIKGHKEVTIPGHSTLCPGSLFPLNLVRAYYLNSKGMTLSEFLVDYAYFPRVAVPSIIVERVAPYPAVQIARNGTLALLAPNDVRMLSGKVFVGLSALTLAMNWPQPEHDAAGNRITVRTTTK